MTHCIYPERQDPDDPDESLPEGWDAWKAGDTCEHDYCVDAAMYYRQYQAEAPYRESLALARQDLDMEHATDAEVATATLLHLK